VVFYIFKDVGVVFYIFIDVSEIFTYL